MTAVTTKTIKVLIDSAKEEERFIYDPKKKISEENRRYEDLLAQKQADESKEWRYGNNRICHRSMVTFGCPAEPEWLHDPQELKKMLEKAQK